MSRVPALLLATALLAGLAAEHSPAIASDAAPAPAPSSGGTLVVSVTIGGGGKEAPKKPLASATVLVYGAGRDGGDRAATTDAQGVAKIAGLAPREYTVRVDADRFVGEEQDVTIGAPGAAKETALDVALTPGTPFDGTVVDDATGAPVAGARVDVLPYGEVRGHMSHSFRVPYARTTSDAQGRFHVNGVAEGQVATVAATAKGHAAAGLSVRILGGNVTPSPVVVRLPPGGSVAGTVRDESGAPIPGAVVYVFPASSENLRQNPRGWFQSSTGKREQAALGRAGPDGRFVVEGLPLDVEYAATAEADGYALCECVEGLRLARSTPDASASLVLKPAATLLVLLVDLDGKPVREAAAVEVGERPGPTEKQTTPHHSNVYRFVGVDPGETVVSAEAPSYRPAWTKAVVVAGKTAQVTLTLDPGVTIEGTVLGEDGKPVEGASVEIEPVGGNDPGPSGWVTLGGRTYDAGADGRFVAQGLAPKEMELSASGSRGPDDLYRAASKVRVKPPAKDVRVVVVLQGSAVLRVLAPDGKPFSGRAMVWHGVRNESRSGSGRDIEGGVVRFSAADEKDCEIEVDVEGFLPVRRGFRGKSRTRIDLGTATLEVGTPVRGRVVDLQGKPVPGANVTGSHSTIAADERGEFVLAHEPKGKVTVSAEADGFLETTHSVDVTPGLAPIELRLPRGALVRGVLRGADGSPLQREFFAWRIAADGTRIGTEEESISPDEDGRFASRLAPGRYRFVVGADNDDKSPPRLGDFELKEGETREIELKLPK